MISKDPFGTYLAAGIASMFALQMFVNVGMDDRHHADHGHPVTVRVLRRELAAANFAAVGLLLNVHMRRFT